MTKSVVGKAAAAILAAGVLAAAPAAADIISEARVGVAAYGLDFNGGGSGLRLKK